MDEEKEPAPEKVHASGEEYCQIAVIENQIYLLKELQEMDFGDMFEVKPKVINAIKGAFNTIDAAQKALIRDSNQVAQKKQESGE